MASIQLCTVVHRNGEFDSPVRKDMLLKYCQIAADHVRCWYVEQHGTSERENLLWNCVGYELHLYVLLQLNPA